MLRICRSISLTISFTRSRFWCVRSSFRSAANLRLLNLLVPAASSIRDLRSSGLALTISSTRPCSTMEYALFPSPVPRKSSIISLRRQGTLFIEYSDSPERKSLRVTTISLKPLYSAGPLPSSFSKTKETSAIPVGAWVSLPLKRTSSMRWPRRW